MWNLIPIYIAGWYFSAIMLAVYNKWMFDPKKGLRVEYPMLLTAFHQITLWIVSAIYIKIHERSRRAAGLEDTSSGRGNNSWKFYLKYIVPTALATAGDIGLSNVSYKFVPLTVYTVIKSSSIAFVLIFSCVFKIETFEWRLAAIVVVMFSGVVMMVYKPDDPNDDHYTQAMILIGSLLVLGSSCLSGLRWTITHLILRHVPKKYRMIYGNENESEHEAVVNAPGDMAASSPLKHDLEDSSIAKGHQAIENGNGNGDVESKNESELNTPKRPHPMYTIYQLAPVMCASLIIMSLIIERPIPGFFHSNLFKAKFAKSTGSGGESDSTGNAQITGLSVLAGIVLILIPGLMVCMLTFCEFGMLQLTKVLTVSVAGIVKEVLTILFGMWLLHERITQIYNWIGMIVVMLDVSYYNYFRYRQSLQRGNQEDTSTLEAYIPPDTTKMYPDDDTNYGNNDDMDGKRDEPLEVAHRYSIDLDHVVQDYEMTTALYQMANQEPK